MVGEIRSHMPWGAVKKIFLIKKKIKKLSENLKSLLNQTTSQVTQR